MIGLLIKYIQWLLLVNAALLPKIDGLHNKETQGNNIYQLKNKLRMSSINFCHRVDLQSHAMMLSSHQVKWNKIFTQSVRICNFTHSILCFESFEEYVASVALIYFTESLQQSHSDHVATHCYLRQTIQNRII